MKTRQVWQALFNDSILNTMYGGPLFVGARKNGRGEWTRDVPQYVREYLCLNETTTKGQWHTDAAPNCAELRKLIERDTEDSKLQRGRYGCKFRFTVTVPEVEKAKARKIPKRIPAIRNLEDLCAFFSADTPQGLNRRIYKGTDCGASISVQTPDGKLFHNGDDWTGVTEITGFTIQTIVEGSDAEVNSDMFYLPCTEAEVENWIKDMEAQASDLWEEANGGDDEDDEEGDEANG